MKNEIGNFARRKLDGKIVEKVISKDGWVSYLEDRKMTGCCPLEEVENVDVKAAFLTRLQELLVAFDAEIVAIIGEDNTDYEDKPKVFISIGDVNVDYERDNHTFCDITAENIFDYDKE